MYFFFSFPMLFFLNGASDRSKDPVFQDRGKRKKKKRKDDDENAFRVSLSLHISVFAKFHFFFCLNNHRVIYS